jgi:hypothetical protein
MLEKNKSSFVKAPLAHAASQELCRSKGRMTRAMLLKDGCIVDEIKAHYNRKT